MLHLRPNHFLFWEAIKRSKINGYKKFDFGRTSDDNKKLGEFKKRWGSKREVLPTYFIPDISGFALTRQKGLAKGMMYYAMKNLPDSLCHLMGGFLYKNLV
jgi:lipid II:glycine glycyltransferase (peptidoglycan interpeptide bridge formation enzyme)